MYSISMGSREKQRESASSIDQPLANNRSYSDLDCCELLDTWTQSFLLHSLASQ